ncbi:hypothetical protein DPMN_017690 [Dreissena polymorpha]|uniref:Uncharacterized protein n=1 Tax=Dreissena polymorpha TaxID=45954 RepID=A0A9D4NBV2_DREPO|nr:hypothetical protein DPMN_017690 [Dreissena polymorpha]
MADVCGRHYCPYFGFGFQKTHVLTKFHDDWTKNVTSRVFTCFHYHIHIEKTAPSPGGHAFLPIWTIFELFHEDWAKLVTSRVNTATPPGGHLYENWASNVTSLVFTSFKISRGINGTNVLTKFHEECSQGKMLTPHDGQKAITKAHYEHVVLR